MAPARPYVVATALSLLLFLACCTFSVGGLAKREWPGDVPHYQTFGQRMVDGQVPYHDFYSEYPPGALPTFYVPAALSERHYVDLFKGLMALLGSVALIASGAILWVLRADRVRTIVALGAIAVAPALLGHVFLNRYDPWPAALVSVALLLVLVRRLRSAFALLAIAVTAKIYAAAALPVAAVRVARVDGRPGLRRALVAFVVAGAIVTLPFAVVGFGGLGDSFYVQSTRPLQIESLGASFLLVGDQLGLYDARFFAGKGNSIDLHGMLPDAVAVLTSLLLLATVALVVWLYVRGRESTEAFLVAFVASITAYVVFFKVFSPQYMTWLVPLVPLVAGTRGRLAVVAFLAALLATQVEIYGFEAIHPIAGSSFLAGRPDPWAPWLLLGRNLLLLGVLALLIGELRALSLPRAAPARAAPAAAPGSYFDPTAAR